jgi:hypothetical protein
MRDMPLTLLILVLDSTEQGGMVGEKGSGQTG